MLTPPSAPGVNSVYVVSCGSPGNFIPADTWYDDDDGGMISVKLNWFVDDTHPRAGSQAYLPLTAPLSSIVQFDCSPQAASQAMATARRGIRAMNVASSRSASHRRSRVPGSRPHW